MFVLALNLLEPIQEITYFQMGMNSGLLGESRVSDHPVGSRPLTLLALPKKHVVLPHLLSSPTVLTAT